MPTFSLECFQNEYLSPGADQVGAIITVRAESAPGEGPIAGDGASLPTAAGAPRTELIIIDVSGSMSGQKIKEAALAAGAAVDCIEDGVQFALIAGNQTVWRLYPSAPGLKLAISSPETRREARKAVSGLRAGGGTAMGSWIGLAAGLVADQEGIRHAILLTDGQNETEGDDALREALDAADGRFQCDCRGVGTDWSVEELKRIADALLGTCELVRTPDQLAADFTDMMQTSMARAIGDVRLRLWTPVGSSVVFVKVVSPELSDLTDRGTQVDERSADYPTGAWSDESRDYHLSIRVAPAEVGEEMLAGRVTLLVDGQPAGQALIRAVWTEDISLSTQINGREAHYTGQEELAELVQDGLEARRNGDADEATEKLGRAVKIAAESGNEVVAESLAKVVDVEDAATGKVHLKKHVDRADEMEAEIGSTKTARVAPAPKDPRVTATCPAGHESEATDFCDHCGLRIATGDGPGPDTQPPVEEIDEIVATRMCANCGDVAESGRFCEGCGFDLEHGTLPAEPAQPGSGSSLWEAVIEIGPDDDREADAGIAAPSELVQRRVPLAADRARVGRRRAQAEDGPEIDLAQDPADTGVSHEHAELVLVDGSWSVVDLGSTNGTYLNDGAEPIEPNQPAPLQEGDRIHIGAWTTITIDRTAPSLTEPPPEPEA